MFLYINTEGPSAITIGILRTQCAEAIKTNNSNKAIEIINKTELSAAEINIPLNREGMTFLGLAAQHGHQNVVEALVKKGANPNLGKPSALFCAARGGHLKVVQDLIHLGANFQVDEWKDSPLYAAMVSGNLALVKYLVDECKVPFDESNVLELLNKLEKIKYTVISSDKKIYRRDMRFVTIKLTREEKGISYLADNNYFTTLANSLGFIYKENLPCTFPTNNIEMLTISGEICKLITQAGGMAIYNPDIKNYFENKPEIENYLVRREQEVELKRAQERRLNLSSQHLENFNDEQQQDVEIEVLRDNKRKRDDETLHNPNIIDLSEDKSPQKKPRTDQHNVILIPGNDDEPTVTTTTTTTTTVMPHIVPPGRVVNPAHTESALFTIYSVSKFPHSTHSAAVGASSSQVTVDVPTETHEPNFKMH